MSHADSPAHPRTGAPFFLGASLCALLVFLFTLSRHIAPGSSASQLAAHSGAMPFAPVDAPLWGILVRITARFSPVVWNGISALLGALVVGLVAWFCSRLSHDRSHEEKRSQLDPLLAGRISGGFAAAVLIASPTFWFAATRALPEMLGVVLLLVASMLWTASLDLSKRRLIYPASLITGLGCVEYATFFILLPVFTILLIAHSLRRRRLDWRRLGACFLLFLTGYSLILYAAHVLHRSPSAEWYGFDSYWECLYAVFRQQKVLLLRSMPRVGWLLLLLTSVLPLAMVLIPKERLQRQSRWPSYLLHLLLTSLAGALVFNSPLSPYGLFRLEPLVVVPCVVNAVWIGYLAGYWWSVLHYHSHLESAAVRRGKQGAALAFPLVLLATAAAALWFSHRIVDPRHTRWTDGYAEYLLRELPDDAVFVSETPVDAILAIKARQAGRKLTLVNPRSAGAASYLAYLKSAWPEPRLRSMVAVGPLQVAAEWLRLDPKAALARLRTDYFDSPLFASGFQAIPSAPFHLSAPAEAAPDLAELSRRLDSLAEQPFMREALEVSRPDDFQYHERWLRVSSAKLANNLGVLAERLNQPQQAEAHYRLARRWNPENPSALLNLAELARVRKLPDNDGLQAELREFIESGLGNRKLALLNLNQVHGLVSRPEAHMQRGLAWAVSGKPSLAAGEIRRAMELTQQSDQLRAFLAFAQFEDGKAAEAEAGLRELLAREPRHVSALAQLARIQAAGGDFVSGRATLARAVEARPDLPVLRLQQAGLELMAGDNASALAMAKGITHDHPAFVEGWALLAHLAEVAGDQQVAREAEKVLTSAEGLPASVYIVLSDLRMRAGDLTAARRLLEEAIRKHPGVPSLLEQLLRVAYQHRDRQLAWQVVTDLLRLDPSHAYANLVLGSLHYHEHEYAYAEAAFRASIATKRTAEALNSLAFVLYEVKRCEEAQPLVEEADALQPGDANTLDTRAMVLLCRGRPQEALALSRRSVELDPLNPILLLNLAKVLDEVGEDAEALRICDTLFERVGQLPPAMQTPLTDLRARLTGEQRKPSSERRNPES